MKRRVAIVTGGIERLGRAMAFGLTREGHSVLAAGHIDADVAEIEAATAGANFPGHILPLVADLRRPAECDRVVAMAQERFGTPQILVNNAGLTFTTIDPARFRRPNRRNSGRCQTTSCTRSSRPITSPPTRWPAASPCAMVEEGWGRIVNVTTKLDTMNRPHTSPYGASKAALEMATEVWSKEVEETGLTINIVNPVAGANTPGMADEMRTMSREGRAPRLVEPEEMVSPLLYVVSREADSVNGWRFDANLWDGSLPPAEAARCAGRSGRLQMHPQPA